MNAKRRTLKIWTDLRDMNFLDVSINVSCPLCETGKCPITCKDFENAREAYTNKNIWAFRQACQVIVDKIQTIEEFYSTGQRFLFRDNEYILSRVDFRDVIMINIKTGCNWSDTITVKSIYKVTEKDINDYFGDDKWKLKY